MQSQKTESAKATGTAKNKNFLVKYIAIMLATALALIVFSYLDQQRKNANEITRLNDQHTKFSVSAMENIESMKNENKELIEREKLTKEELGHLRAEVLSQQLELKKGQQEAQKSLETLELERRKSEALAAFIAIYREHGNENSEAFDALAAEFDAKGFEQLLPAERPAADEPSILEMYLEMKDGGKEQLPK